MTTLTPGLILGDTHCNLHDPKACALVMQVARWLQPTRVIHVGDLVDSAQLSRHPKRDRDLAPLELEIACAKRDVIEPLNAAAPDAARTLLLGNHDWRLEMAITHHLPQIAGLLPEFHHLPAWGNSLDAWQVVPYKSHALVAPRLHATHDVGFSGRYATFQTYSRFQHSVLHGHNHRMCLMTQSNALGESHIAASFGWLGSPEAAKYAHRQQVAEWSLGFGIVWVDEAKGLHYLTPIPIVGYTCCIHGTLFQEGAKVGWRKPSGKPPAPARSARRKKRMMPSSR